MSLRYVFLIFVFPAFTSLAEEKPLTFRPALKNMTDYGFAEKVGDGNRSNCMDCHIERQWEHGRGEYLGKLARHYEFVFKGRSDKRSQCIDFNSLNKKNVKILESIAKKPSQLNNMDSSTRMHIAKIFYRMKKKKFDYDQYIEMQEDGVKYAEKKADRVGIERDLKEKTKPQMKRFMAHYAVLEDGVEKVSPGFKEVVQALFDLDEKYSSVPIPRVYDPEVGVMTQYWILFSRSDELFEESVNEIKEEDTRDNFRNARRSFRKGNVNKEDWKKKLKTVAQYILHWSDEKIARLESGEDLPRKIKISGPKGSKQGFKLGAELERACSYEINLARGWQDAVVKDLPVTPPPPSGERQPAQRSQGASR